MLPAKALERWARAGRHTNKNGKSQIYSSIKTTADKWAGELVHLCPRPGRPGRVIGECGCAIFDSGSLAFRV